MAGGILGDAIVSLLDRSGGILGSAFGPENRDAMTQFGLGLMSGRTNADGWANAMQGLNAGRRSDMLRLEQAREQEERERRAKAAAAMASGLGLSPELAGDSDLVRSLYLAKNKPQDLPSNVREYEYAKRNGFTGSYTDFLNRSQAGGGFGLSPIYGVDAEGNPAIMQIGKDGRAVRTALPDGVRLSRDPIKMDAGTHFVLMDPITRQTIGTVPKDLAGAEQQKAVGKAQGEAQAAAPAAADTARRMIEQIDALKSHPAKSIGTGIGGLVPGVPNTAQKDFVTRFDQIKSGAFLQAFETLKGGGQITEREGQAATAAITRLDRATRQEDFDKALDDLRAIVERGLQRAQAAGGMRAAPGGTTRGGIKWSVD